MSLSSTLRYSHSQFFISPDFELSRPEARNAQSEETPSSKQMKEPLRMSTIDNGRVEQNIYFPSDVRTNGGPALLGNTFHATTVNIGKPF